MGSAAAGGIQFNSTAANGSKYSVKTNFDLKPVNFVSFYDSAMITNWLIKPEMFANGMRSL